MTHALCPKTVLFTHPEQSLRISEYFELQCSLKFVFFAQLVGLGQLVGHENLVFLWMSCPVDWSHIQSAHCSVDCVCSPGDAPGRKFDLAPPAAINESNLVLFIQLL